jgi:hypothetical protein
MGGGVGRLPGARSNGSYQRILLPDRYVVKRKLPRHHRIRYRGTNDPTKVGKPDRALLTIKGVSSSTQAGCFTHQHWLWTTKVASRARPAGTKMGRLNGVKVRYEILPFGPLS